MYSNFIFHVGNYDQAVFYLAIAVFGLWLLRTLKATFFHVYLWQLKEYRLDRFWDHLKLRKNRLEMFSSFFLIRLLAVFIIPLLITSTEMADVLFVIPLIFGGEIIQGIYQFFKKKFKRPVFTKKAVLILLSTLFLQILPPILIGWLYYEVKIFSQISDIAPTRESVLLAELFDTFFIPGGIFMFLILTFLLPITVFLIVLIFKPITYFIKNYYFKKAAEKMEKFSHLKVIGITGSFGKTSTKEFLDTILAQKFNVLKTEKHNNTEIGVAQTILNKLKEEHEIFIVEMGAYKRGEIKTMSEIVKPKIGILTGINEQHLSLFGSLENIKKGKYELIESLPKDGLAVFNGDNENCVELYNLTKKPKLIYSLKSKADVYADQIEIKENGLEFLLFMNQECKKIQSRLLGRHNISNLSAAAAVAKYLGLTLEEIAKGIEKIEPLAQTLKLIEGKNGMKLIDDSYNANPDGILEALEYLKVFKSGKDKRKIGIIMPSMLELGQYAKEAHFKAGTKIGEICDFVIFLDDSFIKEFKKGIGANLDLSKIFKENNARKILDIIEKKIGYNSVVLFESRGAEKVMEGLKRS